MRTLSFLAHQKSLALALLILMGGTALGHAADKERGFCGRVYKDKNGKEAKYFVFIPHAYKGDEAYPLIVFLHGGGESGTDGKLPLRAYLGPAIKKQEASFPFIVVFPQSQQRTWNASSEDGERTMAILAEVQKELRVDERRIIVAGGSMGGAGTWSFATKHPDTWAAIVPICGNGDVKQAGKIKHIPCWCFHGALDKGVSVEGSRRMIEALKAAGGTPKYTEYPEAGHDIGNMVWGTKELLAWLLEQKRPVEPQAEQDKKQAGRPTLSVPNPKAPPQIDGVLDDACWNAAQPVTLGYSIGAWWDAPSQQTVARVLADKKNVYVAVRCCEAEPERIIASGAVKNGMVVGVDTVELFLDPGCRQKRFEYFHVIVTPDGSIFHGKGLDAAPNTGAVTAKVGKFAAGWTVEAAIPFAELGLKEDAIPKAWGLNVCRQRPELGYEMPKAARDAGDKRFEPSQWKLEEPKKYRLAEYTCWSPTMADFCGWPFYSDSRPFHFAERFGRVQLEVGAKVDVPPVARFEVLFKSDFDNGEVGAFQKAVLHEDNYRGQGKSLGFADVENTIRLAQPLENLDDVTLLLTLKMPHVDPQTSPGWNKGPLFHQRLSVFGEAPDGRRCGAERYEIFLSPEMAAARTKTIEEAHQKQFGGGTFELYDTHADMLRWKPCGRVRKGPGPWAMVEGFFAEPSPGQVRWPGTDWTIVRLRLGTFRRDPGPNQGQRLVPREQNYPKGLIFTALPQEDVRMDDVVIFRGDDQEPPSRVSGVKARPVADEMEVSWNRASDNTLTAFYRLYADKKLIAETSELTARLKLATVQGGALTVVAVDLDGNGSAPSEPVLIER
jgi:predicted esterase